jgi:hypothetical protein
VDDRRRFSCAIAQLGKLLASPAARAKQPDAPYCGNLKAEIDFSSRVLQIFFPAHRGTTMRMMLKFTLPIDKGNSAINDGALGGIMESVMGKLKPEAAYFTPMDGKRGGVLFFDITEPSQIIEAVEPLFLNLNASVEIVPVMNGDDLRKGLGKIAKK